jgi:hypothetical protein
LRSRTFDESEGWVIITSTQNPPTCGKPDIELNGAFVNVEVENGSGPSP